MIRGKVDIQELVPVLERAGVERVVYHHADNPRPGIPATICMLCGKGDVVLARGYSQMDSRDQFCRRTGRMVSLRRAVHGLNVKGRRSA